MKIICLNFKMNLLKKDIRTYLNQIENKVKRENTIFFPNCLHINDFYQKGYLVGSQDISFQEFGSITGDTSIHQLKELGISYTIIGHSERRKYFDDDKYVSKKIKLALENNVKTILCIGENIKENQAKSSSFLQEQIDDALKNNLDSITKENLIIAYEPVWAIGSGTIPDNNYLEDTIFFIKDFIKKNYCLDLKVLYGGSVNKDNIESLEKIKNLDGYLIGSESLKPDKILELVQIIQ